MQIITDETKNTSKDIYNNEPVYYCEKCLSLKIRVLGETSEYCDNCGNTNISTTNINTWRDLYKNKYGKEF